MSLIHHKIQDLKDDIQQLVTDILEIETDLEH